MAGSFYLPVSKRHGIASITGFGSLYSGQPKMLDYLQKIINGCVQKGHCIKAAIIWAGINYSLFSKEWKLKAYNGKKKCSRRWHACSLYVFPDWPKAKEYIDLSKQKRKFKKIENVSSYKFKAVISKNLTILLMRVCEIICLEIW